MADFKKMFGNRLYIITAVVLLGAGGLFAVLESMGLNISCEDKVCNVNEPCDVLCNVTNPRYRSVYLYNYDEWTIKFSPEIDDFDLYIKYYGKWRYTNFTMATRLPNVPKDRKYIFVFPRYSTKQFKMVLDLKEPVRIKYDFGSLDPLIIGYEYIYENLSKQVPNLVYINVTKDYKCEPTNITCKPFSYSYIEQRLIGYKIYYNGKRIGVNIDGDKIIGSVNIIDDKLIQWSVPIGDRNFAEYGECRKYEIEKGVCKETNLLAVAP